MYVTPNACIWMQCINYVHFHGTTCFTVLYRYLPAAQPAMRVSVMVEYTWFDPCCFWIRLPGKLPFAGGGVGGLFEFGPCVCVCLCKVDVLHSLSATYQNSDIFYKLGCIDEIDLIGKPSGVYFTCSIHLSTCSFFME